MHMKTAEALSAALAEDWDTPVGCPATATIKPWTVEVTGHARPHHWPQSMEPTITLKGPDGTTTRRAGGHTGPQDWDDFEALLSDMAQEARAAAVEASLVSIGRTYRAARSRWYVSQERARGVTAAAHATGMTKYRIAQSTGIPESTIGRWLG